MQVGDWMVFYDQYRYETAEITRISPQFVWHKQIREWRVDKRRVVFAGQPSIANALCRRLIKAAEVHDQQKRALYKAHKANCDAAVAEAKELSIALLDKATEMGA